MTRRRAIATIAAALVVLLGSLSFLYIKGGSTPVSVNDAVGRFHAATPVPTHASGDGIKGTTKNGPGAAPVTAPESVEATSVAAAADRPHVRPQLSEGVYVYATAGHDEVDVLGGSRHTYPEETTITVRHAGCGITERWDVLEERWDERESCRTPNGDVFRSMKSYHEFFRQGDVRTFECEGFTYPAGAEPGDTWKSTCKSDNTTATTTLRAVGFETVEIGGEELRALHVRADTVISGEQKGQSHRDVWGSFDNGLVLRERAMIDSRSHQAVGETRYQEQYEIKLNSLEPRT